MIAKQTWWANSTKYYKARLEATSSRKILKMASYKIRKCRIRLEVYYWKLLLFTTNNNSRGKSQTQILRIYNFPCIIADKVIIMEKSRRKITIIKAVIINADIVLSQQSFDIGKIKINIWTFFSFSISTWNKKWLRNLRCVVTK